ncbi:hypothetical protein C7M84_011067 [Penaeus vannamei]|uniref:Protein kinase domain-containing protein n=1 Tax=Penaeus vannamei TaxID=6689 RepID=A0A423T283_PENVA|nr:hypothetical protein C7M84_011067 [Penaeus vannamei]
MCDQFEELEKVALDEDKIWEARSMEAHIVTRLCLRHGLPLLTSQQCDAARGENPTVLGEGAFGRALLNQERGLVVKVALNKESLPSFIWEAKALLLLEGVPRVQQLVGICPEQLSLVTTYAGPTLKRQLRALSLRQRALLALQLTETVQAIGARGLRHGDLMPGNICVDASRDDPAVTIIDFGVCSRSGGAGDVGYLAGVAETLFPEGTRAPSLQAFLAVTDGKGFTLGRLSSALGEQLGWQGCLPEDDEDEPDEPSKKRKEDESEWDWPAEDDEDEDEDEAVATSVEDEAIATSDEDEAIATSDEDEAVATSDEDEAVATSDEDEAATSVEDEAAASVDEDEAASEQPRRSRTRQPRRSRTRQPRRSSQEFRAQLSMTIATVST